MTSPFLSRSNYDRTPPAGYPWETPAGQISFASRERGLLTCSGDIYRTEDGGQSWTRSLSLPDGHVWTVRFTSPETAFGADSKGRIWQSGNGGVNWQATATGFSGQFIDMDFADSGHGFAAGENSAMFHTVNGGATWESRLLPVQGNVLSVGCVASGTCWALVIDIGIDEEEIARAAYELWLQRSERPWASAETDWLDAKWRLRKPNALLFTDNGGQSWTNQNSGLDDIIAFSAAPTGDVWVLSTGGIFSLVGAGNWREAPSHPEHLESVLHGVLPVRIRATSRNHAYVVGYEVGSAYIVATHNGGQSWQRSMVNVNGISWVDFIDDRYGWVTAGNYSGTATILATNDGGLTWELLTSLSP